VSVAVAGASDAILRALSKRFSPPEWALLYEVHNGTGASQRRSADGLAINLWPSRGMEIHGVEIKIHRSDWLRELKQPEKSADVQRFCNRWWIAAPPDVVLAGELPPTWGLLSLRGRRLVAEIDAPRLEAEALDKVFVAAIGRRMTECVDKAKALARQEMMSEDEYQRGYADGLARAAPELARVSDNLARLEAKVAQFREATGIEIDGYYGRHGRGLGEAVKKLIHHDARRDASDIVDTTIGRMEALLKALRREQEVLAEFSKDGDE
jgi:hypothetical protein